MIPRPTRTAVASATHATANKKAAGDRGGNPLCHIERHQFIAQPIMEATLAQVAVMHW
jgi:hypothetical protein